MNGELAGRRDGPWAGFRTAYSFPVRITDCIGTTSLATDLACLRVLR